MSSVDREVRRIHGIGFGINQVKDAIGTWPCVEVWWVERLKTSAMLKEPVTASVADGNA